MVTIYRAARELKGFNGAALNRARRASIVDAMIDLQRYVLQRGRAQSSAEG